jgi:acyl-CoA synthetase (AMP-forming)/AMP-acid ligase II
MHGLMSSFPLTLPHAFHRAERLFSDKTIVSARAGTPHRTTYAEWASRARFLAGALDALGVSKDARVGTFAWNSVRHLELYFGVPCTGRVLHTLNVRMPREQLPWIANHAEDEVRRQLAIEHSFVAADAGECLATNAMTRSGHARTTPTAAHESRPCAEAPSSSAVPTLGGVAPGRRQPLGRESPVRAIADSVITTRSGGPLT